MSLEGLMQYINVGGTFVIWILVFCSVVLVAICLERLYVYFRANVDANWLLRQMAVFIGHDKIPEAIEFCSRQKWLLADVFKSGLYRAHCIRDDILDSMEAGVGAAHRRLEANLPILGTIAVIAPFIGLLGTVLGIMQAFNDIAKHGKTGIETVGAGVAEALVTTAGGLFVAILAVAAFNFFKSKIKRMIGEISEHAERLGELLYFKQNGIPFPEDLSIEATLPEKKASKESKG